MVLECMVTVRLCAGVDFIDTPVLHVRVYCGVNGLDIISVYIQVLVGQVLRLSSYKPVLHVPTIIIIYTCICM